MNCHRLRQASLCALILTVSLFRAGTAAAEPVPSQLREAVDRAVALVKPALVRVEVVSTYYSDGREQKYESSGSGVIISKEGHIVTNHHVAGRATRLVCTLSTKEEIEAELVGRDPLTDIAVIKLTPDSAREFPAASFGDSSKVRVGDDVLAMGSPMSLSQSVTLGIISNTELVLPEWMGGLQQEGENVGALVRWFGHDALIIGGNSGGPLVNIAGEIIGINEIKIGLSGAIPGNIAKAVAEELIAKGSVTRSWLGVTVQPLLKHVDDKRGVLVSGVFQDSPASRAGFKSGDVLVRLAGEEVHVQFAEELPGFNQHVCGLPIGQEVQAVVLRDGKEVNLALTPEEREPVAPREHELKQWGLTVRDLSFVTAKEMKRDNRDGVLVTSTRQGGPAGEAKPPIQRDDVIVEVGGSPVMTVEALREVTVKLTEGQSEPVPVLVSFDRKTQRLVTMVEVGIKELDDPGREVRKAWLPVETQVLTRDIVKELGKPDLTGFRITQVFRGTTADKAGLRVGDFIIEVDGEEMTASAPEDYEQLTEWIREYRIGDMAEVVVLRDGERLTIPVELTSTQKLSREMSKYRDDNFEFTVRDITFFDKAREKWDDDQQGVIVENVQSAGWAALGSLQESDLIQEVNGSPVANVEDLEEKMKAVGKERPKAVVFQILRGIYTMYLELEPKWEEAPTGKD
jgi:serine protease Do